MTSNNHSTENKYNTIITKDRVLMTFEFFSFDPIKLYS